MPAPKNNQFWKLRSKHGRDKIFKNPDMLEQAANEYFEWCTNNPLYKAEFLRGGERAGEIVNIPLYRPFTIEGLCLYLGVGKSYWREFKAANHEDFSPIITHVEQVIYTQKFEGAAAGLFNANIIARDLGLVDKHINEIDINPGKKPDWLELSLTTTRGVT